MKIKPLAKPGYTMFRNYIIDHFMPKLSGSGWKVLCVAIRQTWGWADKTTESGRKEKDRIAYSQFLEMTGIKSSATLRKAIKENLDNGFLLREQNSDYPQQFNYRINEDYEVEVETTSEIEGVGNGATTTLETEVVRNKTALETKVVLSQTTLETEDTKESIKKENIKKDTFGDFFPPKPTPPPIESKPIPTDYLQHIAQHAGKGKSWTVPAEAGGLDSFKDGPVDAFCVLVGVPPSSLPAKKREQWAKKLRQIAEEWSTEDAVITAGIVEKAIRAVPDDEHIGWKTYTSPYTGKFDVDIGPLLLNGGQPRRKEKHGTRKQGIGAHAVKRQVASAEEARQILGDDFGGG